MHHVGGGLWWSTSYLSSLGRGCLFIVKFLFVYDEVCEVFDNILVYFYMKILMIEFGILDWQIYLWNVRV